MLALWEYFWTESDWTGGSPPIVPAPDPTTPGRGSGKAYDEYQSLSDEYWQEYATKYRAPDSPAPETLAERQQRLLEETRKIIDEQNQLSNLMLELANTKHSLQNASTIDELKQLAAYSASLQQEISKLEATNKARIIRAKSLRFSLYH